jgi:hypothetical protein
MRMLYVHAWVLTSVISPFSSCFVFRRIVWIFSRIIRLKNLKNQVEPLLQNSTEEFANQNLQDIVNNLNENKPTHVSLLLSLSPPLYSSLQDTVLY